MIIKRIMQGSNLVTFCDINCPKCNRIAKLLDYHIDSKEVIECPVCGYEQTLNRETNETKIRYGYGVFYAEFLNKPFMYIIFDEPISKTDKENLLKIFDDYFLVKEKSYFYLYEPHIDELTILKGVVPQTFDDYIDEQQQQVDYEKMLSSYRYQSLCSDDYVPFE